MSAYSSLTSALSFYAARHRRTLRHTGPRPESSSLYDTGASRNHLVELVLQRGGRHGCLERDLPRHVERGQRLIERLGAEFFLARLHRRIDLMDLVFANQVADGGRRHQDFLRDDAASAIRFREQRLTDDSFEHQRQLRADL